jgi:hypothetical protein
MFDECALGYIREVERLQRANVYDGRWDELSDGSMHKKPSFVYQGNPYLSI